MKTKFLSFCALSALLFASCSSDDYEDSSPKPIQFTTKVEVQGIATRVVELPTWSSNDAIGVYMLKAGTDTIAENATNKKYTTPSGNGIFSATGNNVIYYPIDPMQKVDFIAYSPYSDAVSSMVYPINLANQTDQKALDFLYADKVPNKDKASTSVLLNFKHKLVKVHMNITAGTGITSLAGLTIKIKNVKTQGSADLKTGTLTIGDALGNIDAESVSSSYFEATLMPLSAFSANNIVEFVLDGNTYIWNMANITGNTFTSLDAGSKYIYSITINKTGLSGVSATIENWNIETASGVAS